MKHFILFIKKIINANETYTKGGSVIQQSSAKILRKPEKTNSIMESEAGSTHKAAIVRYEVLSGVLLTIQGVSNVAMYRIIRQLFSE